MLFGQAPDPCQAETDLKRYEDKEALLERYHQIVLEGIGRMRMKMNITMQLQADKLIRMALEEDITSEDVSTNAVMPTNVKGTVDLIAKEDGVIAGWMYMPEF